MIFITTETDRKNLVKVASFFFTMGALNSIIVTQKRESQIVYSFNVFAKEKREKFYEISCESATIDCYFPDKLKNLHGHSYRVTTYNEFPRVYTVNNKFHGTALDFLNTVVRHQNATYKNSHVWEEIFLESFIHNKNDFSLNSVAVLDPKAFSKMEFVNTFETDGFCVMLPHAERKSFFSFVLKPFDLWTWIFLMASVIGLVIAWYFLNKHSTANPNSAGYFFFALVSFFLGQGLNFREHRLMQKVLIQLMVMMTFILGNAYQSELISLMTESRFGDQLSSVQDIIDSDFTFHTDPTFLKMFESSEINEGSERRFMPLKNQVKDLNFKELASEGVGLILPCSVIDSLYMNAGDLFDHNKDAIDYYYRLPTQLYSYYLRFPMGPFSPFTERLQEYSLRIFESGIKEHWKTMRNFEDMAEVKQRKIIANEEFYMNLQDMMGAFYCLGIGFALSTLAFVVEIWRFNFRQWMRRWRNRNRVDPQVFIELEPFEIV